MKLFVCRSFVDAETCRKIRQAMDDGETEPADVLAGNPEGRRASFRNPGANTVRDTELMLDALRGTVASFFAVPLVDREGAGFVRYGVGDHYGRHRDSGSSREWPDLARRSVSAVLFLSSCDGGRLRLHGRTGPTDVTPEPGLVVAFPSDTVHEVLPVTGGTRDVVVDWFYGPLSRSSF